MPDDIHRPPGDGRTSSQGAAVLVAADHLPVTARWLARRAVDTPNATTPNGAVPVTVQADQCGTYSRYVQRGCRCDECRRAQREYKQRRRAVAPRCSIDQCESPQHARGWCKVHYARWCRTGTPHPSPRSAGSRVDRLWRFIQRSPSGCWEWVGRRDVKGYGRCGDGRWAHRAIYELLVEPIPQGLTIDHLCFNPGCVNPAHLEPVTRAENTRRMNAKRKATIATPPDMAPVPSGSAVASLVASSCPEGRRSNGDVGEPGGRVAHGPAATPSDKDEAPGPGRPSASTPSDTEGA